MTGKKSRKWTVILGIVLLAAPAGAAEEAVLKTPMDKVNYGIGINLMRNFKYQGIDVDLDLVIKGMRDAQGGGKLLMSEDEMRKIMTAFQAEVRKKQAYERRIATIENRKTGDAFLAENKAKEGVVTLPSGLQYKVLKAGVGKKPAETDTVECNYRGALINGTELDKSEPGKPATFKLSAAIPGWKEALLLMPEGSKWQLFIPPHLAYGEKGGGGKIGPNATLIFEVELVAIH